MKSGIRIEIVLLLMAALVGIITLVESPQQAAVICAESYTDQVDCGVIVRGYLGDIEIGHGSGVVVSSGGMVFTAKHVAQMSPVLKIEFADGTLVEVTSVTLDSDDDCAILQTGVSTDEFSPIDFKFVPVMGEPVYSVSTPGAAELKNTVTFGRVANGVRYLDDSDYFVADMTVTFGCSGGAVYDADGKVIGIISAFVQGSGIALVVPVTEVVELIEVNSGL